MDDLEALHKTLAGYRVGWAVAIAVAGPCIGALGLYLFHICRSISGRLMAVVCLIGVFYLPLCAVTLLVLQAKQHSLVEYATEARYGFLVGLALTAVFGIAFAIEQSGLAEAASRWLAARKDSRG